PGNHRSHRGASAMMNPRPVRNRGNIGVGAGTMVCLFDYNQAKDSRWLKFQNSMEGACFGISYMWVQYSRLGTDFLAWLVPPPDACSTGVQTGVGNASANQSAQVMNEVTSLMSSQDKLNAVRNKLQSSGSTGQGQLENLDEGSICRLNRYKWAHA